MGSIVRPKRLASATLTRLTMRFCPGRFCPSRQLRRQLLPQQAVVQFRRWLFEVLWGRCAAVDELYLQDASSWNAEHNIRPVRGDSPSARRGALAFVWKLH